MKRAYCLWLIPLLTTNWLSSRSTPFFSNDNTARIESSSRSPQLQIPRFRAGAHHSVHAQPQGLSFAPAVTYGSDGWSPYSVAVADVNRDGNPDLIVANQCTSSNGNCNGSLAVLLGNGDGTFRSAVTYDSGGGDALSVAVSDVSGDGNPDILAANASGSVSVLLGNGDGTFQTAVTYVSGGYSPDSIAVADVNGDGKPDLLVANQCADNTCGTNGTVGVLLGNGDGTFGTTITFGSGGFFAWSVAVADVNGDGSPDLIVASICVNAPCNVDTSGAVGVLLGNGNGTFQSAVTYASGGYDARSVAVADVNGDGKPDLLVANVCSTSSGSCESQNASVGVLLGNGDGTFQTAVPFGSGGDQALSVAVSDVNGDGKPDLLVANACASNCANSDGMVTVLLGNGDGTFQPAVTYDSNGLAGVGVAAADVNGDGKPDLIVVNECATNGNCGGGFGSVGVLLNTSTSTSSTSLVSSLNPSNLGMLVTLTATVTAPQRFYNDIPTGTVSFFDGTTNIGNPSVSSSGLATLTTSTLAVGAHSITATYNGDPNFAPSTSSVLSQVVQGAIAVLSPTSVNFGNQTVGTGNQGTLINLTNTGNIALTISSIGITGANSADFSQTNLCGSSLAAGGNCSITVKFTPTTTGTRTAALSVTDNAPGSPQTVSLTGVGVTPIVILSPASLTFSTQVVFTRSKAQTVTLTNTGLGVLIITGVSVASPFSETNTCGSSVAAGANCTFSVTFRPTHTGTVTGSISITDNASGSSQKIALTGIGTDIQLSPTSLNFGNQPVGTKSLSKKITLSNKGSVSVSITNISLTGTNAENFSQTNTCGTTVKSGASCSISVNFTPSARGKRTANVSVNDNGGGSPQIVGLTGTGT